MSAAALRNARRSGVLNLSGADFVAIPPAVFHLDHDLDESEKWWEVAPLTKLDLSDNRLTTVPDDVASLTALVSLRVVNNRLADVSPALFELPALKSLDLAGNALRRLPETLGSAAALVELGLSRNALVALPSSLGSLESLEILRVSQNALAHFPCAEHRLERLLELALDHNKLAALDDAVFAGMPRLRTLSLRGNQLTHLPRSLEDLLSLVLLDVRENRLVDTPCLPRTTTLDQLLLGANQLSVLAPERLAGAPRLGVLDLSDNQLASLPDSVASLVALHTLDLRNNNLANLPFSLGFLPRLTRIALDGNPLRALRRTLWTAGAEELKRFLRSRCPEGELDEWEALMHDIDARGGGPAGAATTAAKRAPASGGGGGGGSGGARGGGGGAARAGERSGSGAARGGGARGAEDARDEADEADEDDAPLRTGVKDGIDWEMAVRDAAASHQFDVRGRRATLLPRGLLSRGRLTGLAVLDLSDNALEEDSVDLALRALPHACPDLQRVDVSRNRLRRLPLAFGQLPRLLELAAAFNRLTSEAVDALGDPGDADPSANVWTCLRSLDLRNNALSHLPRWLSRATELETLLVGSNQLGLAEGHSRSERSERSAESISEHDRRLLIPTLTTVDLSQNRLTRVPETLLLLPALQSLDLENNDIAVIPPHLGFVATLRTLRLGGNPQRVLRQTLLQSGTPAVLDFLRSRVPVGEEEKYTEMRDALGGRFRLTRARQEEEARRRKRIEDAETEKRLEARVAARPGDFYARRSDKGTSAGGGRDIERDRDSERDRDGGREVSRGAGSGSEGGRGGAERWREEERVSGGRREEERVSGGWREEGRVSGGRREEEERAGGRWGKEDDVEAGVEDGRRERRGRGDDRGSERSDDRRLRVEPRDVADAFPGVERSWRGGRSAPESVAQEADWDRVADARGRAGASAVTPESALRSEWSARPTTGGSGAPSVGASSRMGGYVDAHLPAPRVTRADLVRRMDQLTDELTVGAITETRKLAVRREIARLRAEIASLS